MAGMFGQACTAAGAVKNTYGTAGVLTANTGERPALLDGLTASVGWTLEGRTDYEAEGVVFHSGQTLQWMREKLKIMAPDEHSQDVAAQVPDTERVGRGARRSGIDAASDATPASTKGESVSELQAENALASNMDGTSWRTAASPLQVDRRRRGASVARRRVADPGGRLPRDGSGGMRRTTCPSPAG